MTRGVRGGVMYAYSGLRRGRLPARHWTVEELRRGLAESVRYQSHYAELLNMHDGGGRISFQSADAWLKGLSIKGRL